MSPDPAPYAPVEGARAVTPRVRLDQPLWCGWWRDLIVERYRIARFDDVTPLPDGRRCPWARRVELGQVVEQSLAAVHGPAATSRLVADALGAAGFGVVREAADGTAGDRGLGRRSIAPGPSEASLRWGVLGTIADALLRDARLEAEGSEMEAIVCGATRTAILAYAGHVEALAERSLLAARGLRSAQERGAGRRLTAE